MRRIAGIISASALLAGLVWAQGGAAAPPNYDFTVTPAVPVAGQPAAFTATGLKPKDVVAWDFENDGVFDATGTVVQHVYPTSGQRIVLMRVTKDDGEVRNVLKPVAVDAPPPVTQPPVTQPPVSEPPVTQPPVTQPPVSEPPVSQPPVIEPPVIEPPVPTPGRPEPVAPAPFAPVGVFPQLPTAAPLELMSPFPIIRIVGRTTSRGAAIRLLAVRNAPRGARVTVRCRGRGCPLRSRRRSTILGRARLRPLERSVPAGVLIRIYVTQPGKIGKYTSFRIRRARRPLRRDRCTEPGIAVARRCPAS